MRPSYVTDAYQGVTRCVVRGMGMERSRVTRALAPLIHPPSRQDMVELTITIRW